MSYWIEFEKQKQLSKVKTVAFASAAHEFKNPLNGIVSALEILEPLVQNERQGKYFFDVAKNCSNLMLFLVKDIQDLSQMESKTFSLNLSYVNIKKMISECASILKNKITEKKLELMIEYPSSLPS